MMEKAKKIITRLHRKTRGFFAAFLLALFFSVLLPNLSGETKGEEKEIKERYNVIIIVVNSLRADHLGYYGYFRNTSPNIDQLAQSSLFFDRAMAQSNWTLPSLVSMLTSKYVCGHGVDSRDKKLDEETKTLPAILKMYNYQTAAFTGGLDTMSVYGLNQGFDVYGVYFKENDLGKFADIIPRAVEWLKENKNKNFFLFLHGYDVHPPYEFDRQRSFSKNYEGVFNTLPIEYSVLKEINHGQLHLDNHFIELKKRDIDHVIACYDDNIRRADEAIGDFLEELKRLKIYDNTIIILCADHGEELGERGTFNRFGSQTLYEEVMRIPLIIKYPAVRITGRRIHSLVGLVDLMPTLLDLLNIPQDNGLQGLSFASFVTEENPADEIHDLIMSEAGKDKWAVLRNDNWKLIHSPAGTELYNLNDDPGEQKNLIERFPGLSLSLKKDFFLWRENHKNKDGANNRLKLDKEFVERLRKAGYW